MPPQLSLTERLSYGLGNFGVNLIFGMTGAFLMYFYTDVYRIDAGTVATLFLVARTVDALFDPLLGLLIDRTRSRHGKHRPYLIWLSLPFALCGIAVFATPELDGTLKLIYVYLSYTLLGMLYSGLSLPLNSMLPTLTRDPGERSATNALREFLGTGATVGVGYVTLPLVERFGDGSPAHGFMMVAALFGAISVALLALAFHNTRERVEPLRSPHVLTTAQSLSATRGNLPWISTMLVNFCFWIGFIAHVQSYIYFADNVLVRHDAVPKLMLTMLAMLIGTALSAPLANRIGKRLTGIFGSTIAALATAALGLSDDFGWQLALNAVSYTGLGLIGGLLFALMADAVDYGEWRNGFRAQGFLFAASSFGVKLGLSIGGAIGAWLLAHSGYVAGATPNAAVVAGITWGHVWVPSLSYAAMGASLALFIVEPEFARLTRSSGAVAPNAAEYTLIHPLPRAVLERPCNMTTSSSVPAQPAASWPSACRATAAARSCCWRPVRTTVHR
ncbi:MAG: glycoside-pentoside-hexuronide (GPH):cation symporter [Pseudomonas sp.]